MPGCQRFASILGALLLTASLSVLATGRSHAQPATSATYSAYCAALNGGGHVEESASYGHRSRTGALTGTVAQSESGIFRIHAGFGCQSERLAKNSADPVANPTEAKLPDRYRLEHNYPNPFNPQTTIGFALPEAEEVRLAVYDALGRHVQTLVDGHRTAGHHEIVFRAGPLPSGVYLYQISTGGFTSTRSMVLMK